MSLTVQAEQHIQNALPRSNQVLFLIACVWNFCNFLRILSVTMFLIATLWTSSSAVAERPCDASCHWIYRSTMALSCIISKIKRVTSRQSWFFHTLLHSTPPLGGPHWSTTTMFVIDKPERCNYLTVKKIWGYVLLFRQNTRVWHTDGRTDILQHHSPRYA